MRTHTLFKVAVLTENCWRYPAVRQSLADK